jgi:transposase DDE domain
VNQHIGISSGGRTTKIHAAVDGLGNPIYISLTAGQIHDSTQAIEILSRLNIEGSNILADKAYGTQEIREYIEKQGAIYTIPPKSNTKDKWEWTTMPTRKDMLWNAFSTGLSSIAE